MVTSRCFHASGKLTWYWGLCVIEKSLFQPVFNLVRSKVPPPTSPPCPLKRCCLSPPLTLEELTEEGGEHGELNMRLEFVSGEDI